MDHRTELISADRPSTCNFSLSLSRVCVCVCGNFSLYIIQGVQIGVRSLGEKPKHVTTMLHL